MVAEAVPGQHGCAAAAASPTSEDVPVHPVAALFPMMSDDELDDLAADIKAHGLLHAIVLDAEGLLIDGRNRLEACRRAGVAPGYSTLAGGVDPVAFILSSNVTRRHLSKSQQAMAVVRAHQVTSGMSLRELAETFSVSREPVRRAAAVAEHAPELVEAVLVGAEPLNDAYRIATDRKRAAESTYEQMGRLRLQAPDLADLVTEERMALSEALAALRERHDEARRERHAVTQNLLRAVDGLQPGPWTPEERAAHIAAHLEPDMAGNEALSLDGLRGCRAVLEALIRHLEGGA